MNKRLTYIKQRLCRKVVPYYKVPKSIKKFRAYLEKLCYNDCYYSYNVDNVDNFVIYECNFNILRISSGMNHLDQMLYQAFT